MKTVYFVRHGESEINVHNYSYGDGNAPLTEKGRAQAILIADRCAKLPAAVMVVSTMRRAQETADAISKKLNVDLISSDLFRERKPPLLLESNDRYKEPLLTMRKDWLLSFYSESARIADGENFIDIKKRAGDALSYLEQRPEENILVVAHSFILRTILAHVLFGDAFTTEELKKTMLRVQFDNTGISIIEFDPSGTAQFDTMPVSGWTMRTWNDQTHLGDV
jgi:broad specificity phosphatase PhoE